MNRYKIYLGGFCAVCMLFAGCGQESTQQEPLQQESTQQESTQQESAQQGAGEASEDGDIILYFHQSRHVDNPIYAEGFSGGIWGSIMTEGELYYLCKPMTGLDKTLRLYQIPMEELFCEDPLSGNYAAVMPAELTGELPLPGPLRGSKESILAEENILRFFQGQDKGLHCLSWDWQRKIYYLYHIDEQGQELSKVDVTEALQDMVWGELMLEAGYLENSSCGADSRGRVYLTDQGLEMLWVLDADGELLMKVSLPQGTRHLTVGPDDRAYLVTGEGADSQIKRLDDESGGIIDVMDMPQTVGAGAFAQGENLLYRDHEGLYSCDPVQGNAELIVSWSDLNISGKNVLQARETGEGKLYVWGDDYVLTQACSGSRSDIPAQKQKVTVAVLGSLNMLDQVVAEFNKNNAYYEAAIVEYDYFDGPQKLETELASGKAPDLLDVNLLYLDKLVEKNILADISPYLEDGKGIEREDLLEAVLRCNTIDGVLTCIPESFALEVLVGKPQLLGDTPGWTIEEYKACIQENKGLEVMGSNRFSYSDHQSAHAIVSLPLEGDLEHWVDYRQGKAQFTNEDFRSLLELAGDYKVTQPAVKLEEIGELEEGRMLTYVASLYDMEDYLLINAALQQDVVYKGYPTSDGAPAYSMICRNGYAINASSQAKDAAWALIEFILTQPFADRSSDTDKNFIYFSALESLFAYQMKQAMVKKYQLDNYYDVVYDEEGQPLEVSKYKAYDQEGHVTAESLAARAEDVEALRRVIDAARSSAAGIDSLRQIVLEEMSALLNSQRDVDRTVEVIQSRVQLFLDENN